MELKLCVTVAFNFRQKYALHLIPEVSAFLQDTQYVHLGGSHGYARAEPCHFSTAVRSRILVFLEDSGHMT